MVCSDKVAWLKTFYMYLYIHIYTYIHTIMLICIDIYTWDPKQPEINGHFPTAVKNPYKFTRGLIWGNHLHSAWGSRYIIHPGWWKRSVHVNRRKLPFTSLQNVLTRAPRRRPPFCLDLSTEGFYKWGCPQMDGL